MAAVQSPDSDIVVDTLCCSVWCRLRLVTHDVLAAKMLTHVALLCCCIVAVFGAGAANARRMPPCNVYRQRLWPGP